MEVGMKRENGMICMGAVLSAGLLSAVLTAMLLSGHYQRACFRTIGRICQELVEASPGTEQTLLGILKENRNRSTLPGDADILLAYGYGAEDFLFSAGRGGGIAILAGSVAGGGLFLGTLLLWRRKERAQIRSLTDHLERVNAGGSDLLWQTKEGEFSRLGDEICKTVTALRQTRDAALCARNNFADNLSNIAHQIKTPITALSLSVQLMKEDPSREHLEHMSGQLARLTRLEEALLLLSRVDAGILDLERREVDVFTLLTLTADELQELLEEAGIFVDIPEAEGMTLHVDPEWTMEAVMNLMKNCMEHTPQGGCIHCSYEQNPLYTQIRIWDEGEGFAKEDLPHIFQRFYRGQGSHDGGMGIGLALSRAIIERQDGTIGAGNLPEGGACFEIRFYDRHRSVEQEDVPCH